MTDAEPVPEIETSGARCIVGTARSYTMQTRNRIPEQWQAFFEAGHQISDAVDGAMYGVSFDGDENGFRYAVGVEVAQRPEVLPEGCCAVTLSEGAYAVLRLFGAPSDLPRHFDWLLNNWLAASPYSYRDGAMFELYPEDARNGPDGMAYEIWMPVERGA
ncbi:GyrI-like domain-containing protein [Seohaeicola saemankumensis]|nr:GyrI-like domain-containing protein [Seohaeicola saemankumensis]MCA0873980.1 GyrI-like domain-containing protein [Seohaeicola saemankumensis]